MQERAGKPDHERAHWISGTTPKGEAARRQQKLQSLEEEEGGAEAEEHGEHGMKAGGGDKADTDCPCDRPQKRVGCQPAELIGQDEPSAKTAEQRPAIAAQ